MLYPLGSPLFTAWNSNGQPLAGGKLYCYEAGTTTAKATYADASGASANAFPVVLNARGEAPVFFSGAAKFVLTDASDVEIWSADYVGGNGVAEVSSMDGLRALGVPAGLVSINLLGYYAPGDGGGGQFYWDEASTATDNGGTIILPTGYTGSGRWVRQTLFVFYPEWFGAKGDGVTDDSVALSAAALAAGGKHLMLSRGRTYATPSLTLPDNTTLQGGGGILGLSGADDTLILGTNCHLFDITVDGNKAAKTGGHGISATGKSGVVIDRCVVTNTNGKGIQLDTTTDSRITRTDVTNTDGQGINLFFSDRIEIISCTVDTAQHGIQWWGGDSADAAVTTYISDITIASCRIKNTAGGIWGSRGQRITVTGCNVMSCTDVGIDFEGCTAFAATGNVVTGADNGGIACFFGSNAGSITGNTILITSTTGNKYGVWFTPHSNKNITVTGNEIISQVGAAYGIYADLGTEHCVFSGNTLHGCYFRLLKANNNRVTGGVITDGKLTITGGIGNHVDGVLLRRVDLADAAAPNDAPVYIYWVDATWHAQRNTVTNCVVTGWAYAITDDCWGDNASYNDCSYNRVSGEMSHRGTTAWAGRMVSNILVSNPNTAATVASY